MLATAPSRSYPLGSHFYHMIMRVHVLFAQLQYRDCFHLLSSDLTPELTEYVGIQRQILPYRLQSQVSRMKVCLKYH